MPAPPQADRRNVLAWGATGALVFGIASQASAVPAPQRPTPPARADLLDRAHKPDVPGKREYVDNVVMIAELVVKPERLDEFLEYTASNLKISRSYPGNIAFDILIDESQPARVVFYEVWTSPKAQKAYMAWRVQMGDLSKLMSFLAGEPKFTALRCVAA